MPTRRLLQDLSAPPSAEQEQAIRTRIVRELFDRSRPAIVTMLVLLAVIRWAIDDAYAHDAVLRAAFLVMVAVNLVRFALASIPQARREAWFSRPVQFALFFATVALSSLMLATIVVRAWPLLEPAGIAILAVITSGIVSGAVMSVGFSLGIYTAYMLPPIGALFWMAVTDVRPPWGADLLATAFAIYGLAVVAISFDQRRLRRRAISLELQLSDLVVRDALTRLHNRLFLQEYMAVESARLARDALDVEQGREPRRPVATGLFMMDIDHFKAVNDTHGHAAGDVVLKATGEVLCDALRASDNLVRWGGEEFVAVSHVAHADDVRVVAEKLRATTESTPVDLPNGGGTLHRTLSIGVAAMPFLADRPGALGWEQVLALADAALYVAKTEGRNRWIVVHPGAVPWRDPEAAFAEAVQDLAAAERRGLVRLERGASGRPPGGKAAAAPDAPRERRAVPVSDR